MPSLKLSDSTTFEGMNSSPKATARITPWVGTVAAAHGWLQDVHVIARDRAKIACQGATPPPTLLIPGCASRILHRPRSHFGPLYTETRCGIGAHSVLSWSSVSRCSPRPTPRRRVPAAFVDRRLTAPSTHHGRHGFVRLLRVPRHAPTGRAAARRESPHRAPHARLSFVQRPRAPARRRFEPRVRIHAPQSRQSLAWLAIPAGALPAASRRSAPSCARRGMPGGGPGM